MALAWPLAVRMPLARAHANRKWWRAIVPAVLVFAGALLLAPHGAGPARPADPAAPPAWGVDGGAFTLIGALLVVGGALAALPWILSRVGTRTHRGGAIDVVETRPLGGRRSLVLVQVGKRRFLIGASEQGMSALAEVDPAESFAEVARAAVAAGGEGTG